LNAGKRPCLSSHRTQEIADGKRKNSVLDELRTSKLGMVFLNTAIARGTDAESCADLFDRITEAGKQYTSFDVAFATLSAVSWICELEPRSQGWLNNLRPQLAKSTSDHVNTLTVLVAHDIVKTCVAEFSAAEVYTLPDHPTIDASLRRLPEFAGSAAVEKGPWSWQWL
jgi:hypothetical protein